MSQDERKGGWLGRVFGTPVDSRPESALPLVDATRPTGIVRLLEDEVANLRAALGTMEEERAAHAAELSETLAALGDTAARARQHADDLDRMREERDLLRARLQEQAMKAAEEAASAKEELARANGDLAKERARNHALTATHKHAVAAAERSGERTTERYAALEKALAEARRSLAVEADAHGRVVAGLRELLDGAAAALDLVLGRRAALAVRGAGSPPQPAREGGPALREVVAALEHELRASGWVEGIQLADAAEGAARVEILVTAARPVEAALVEAHVRRRLEGRGDAELRLVRAAPPPQPTAKIPPP